MPESSPIILISGPPGAGKSTVARLLVAASNEPIAYIEGDAFWQFIARSRCAATADETRMENARIVVQAMLAAAARYARGGYPTILDFTIRPSVLKSILAKMKETPFDYVVLCPSEAVCAQRAAARAEGAMPDYSPYRELHAAFCDLGEFEQHAIRSDTADAAELATQIRAGLDASAYRVKTAE
jgi:adenylate kinase family enzyme